MKKILRLGTRGSPLALIQAQIAKDHLQKQLAAAQKDYSIEIVPIRTMGDFLPGQKNQTFLEMGGSKGLFTKEIEEALLGGTIDFAIHSMKDVSIWAPKGLVYGAMLRRADPRDAFLSPMAPCVQDLPAGARVGTASLRRKAQILALRPDLTVVPLRGNVDTRLRKLAAEEADATLLAVAGLSRLGMLDRAASIMDPSIMLPAPAQGILGVEVREDDAESRDLLASINDRETELCGLAERAVLRQLDGSCRTPVAALATLKADGTLFLDALAASVDGTRMVRKTLSGPMVDAVAIGDELGAVLRAEMPPDLFMA